MQRSQASQGDRSPAEGSFPPARFQTLLVDSRIGSCCREFGGEVQKLTASARRRTARNGRSADVTQAVNSLRFAAQLSENFASSDENAFCDLRRRFGRREEEDRAMR